MKLLRRLLYGAVSLTLIGGLIWQIAPSFSGEQGWKTVAEAAPSALRQQLEQDYAPHVPPAQEVDVGQMHILKLQESGAFPLHLINTRVHSLEHPDQTPTCGMGGCLFLGYIPDKSKYKQVLNQLINDFQVEGAPPVIQSTRRVLNGVPCFQLTTYNPSTQRVNPNQTLCFNGKEFVQAGNEPKSS